MTVEKDKELKEIGELDDKIFKLCKEKMRTEKKSLQMLHQPDQESSEQAQMQATKKCLLKIGDHIEKTITAEYKHDHNQADTWRRCVSMKIFILSYNNTFIIFSLISHVFYIKTTIFSFLFFFVLVICGLLCRNLQNLGLQNFLSCIKQRAGNAIYKRRKFKQ